MHRPARGAPKIPRDALQRIRGRRGTAAQVAAPKCATETVEGFATRFIHRPLCATNESYPQISWSKRAFGQRWRDSASTETASQARELLLRGGQMTLRGCAATGCPCWR